MPDCLECCDDHDAMVPRVFEVQCVKPVDPLPEAP